MSEPQASAVAADCAPSCADVAARLSSLQSAGAQRFDPLRWRYIEALAARAALHEGSVKALLDARLTQALAAFQERFYAAQSEAGKTVEDSGQRFPDAAGELQRLFDAGEFQALRRFQSMLEHRSRDASLGALVQLLEHHAAESADARAAVSAAPAELKTVRRYRTTWSKLSIDKQVAKALEQAPRDAGPINSHNLVLRSLALMREISPDYLNRFMTYADTLLSLDQGEKDKVTVPKKQTGRTAKK